MNLHGNNCLVTFPNPSRIIGVFGRTPFKVRLFPVPQEGQIFFEIKTIFGTATARFKPDGYAFEWSSGGLLTESHGKDPLGVP